MSGFRKRTIDQKIIDFNRANTDVPRYKIIISKDCTNVYSKIELMFSLYIDVIRLYTLFQIKV